MDDMEIEDKIKELRKKIYHLKNCRKKQPKLADENCVRDGHQW